MNPRTWILADDRLSTEYANGVTSFLDVASNHLDETNQTRCPCRRCVNRSSGTLQTIRGHLMRFGFTISYDVWVCHGEKEHAPSTFLGGSSSRAHVVEDTRDAEVAVDEESDDDDVMGPMYEDLARGFENSGPGQHSAQHDHHNYFGKNEEKLYPSCKYSTLETVIRFLHIKVVNRWSDKSFDMLLSLINLMWPDLNNFPASTYAARKKLRDVGLGYEKIDACVNDCCLFWKERANDDKCHVCNEDRYRPNNGKGKTVGRKILRYFRLTPRLQRLFLSRYTAEDMIWHKEKRDDSGDALKHPADGEAWEHFDQTYPDFAADARNVRLGLASDGFCPFSASYSMWPVILVPYNLPPWKCMQEPFRMLSLLIPGPTSPGKDIDVFLRPLIDELNELWTGVDTFDAATKEKFNMRAALLWTINDFPAYGILSGWSTHGKMACPVCLENTASESITSKICYMGARQHLDMSHPWRRSKLSNGRVEYKEAPQIKSGEEILAELEKRLPNIVFGKHPNNKDNKRKRSPDELNWTKKSIFFELPYWCKLLIRHMLDVMHIEKNICDNVLYTLLDILGRSKDTLKARIDLEKRGIRKGLHLKRSSNGKFLKPAAPYVLNASDRNKFLEFLTSVKYPDGYAANLSRGVNVREGKIFGLKSHDSHVIFQRLLPIGIRPFLPKDICNVLVEFSLFFQQLTSKSLCKSDLDGLQQSIVMVLCKLERIYPPAFFDVMIHLSVHLAREARLAGPVGMRWMYPFERDMGGYKRFIRNRAHPEGSIAEAYSIKEALTFCSMYFDENETQFRKPERNDDEVEGLGTISVFSQKVKPYGSVVLEDWSKSEIEKIHWVVLHNCGEEIEDFVNEHMTQLENESSDKLFERHQKYFPSWFEQRVKVLKNEGSPRATNELFALSKGPARTVYSYPGCIVNGVRFRTKERDELKKTQNSGVTAQGEHDDDVIDFYGHLTSVVVLNYIMDYKVVLFKCTWYDTDPKKFRIKRDYHFKSVNTKDKWYLDDPYILAIQAKQVFYVDDLKRGRGWKIIQVVELRQVWDILEKGEGEDDTVAYQQTEFLRVDFADDDDVDPDELILNDEYQGRGGMEVADITDEETNNNDDAFIDDECLDEIDTDFDSDS